MTAQSRSSLKRPGKASVGFSGYRAETLKMEIAGSAETLVCLPAPL